MANEIGVYAAGRMRYYCEDDSAMGYDQSQRMSERETDCSQLYLRCCDEALRHYGFPGLDTSGYTGNMCRICREAGAEILDYDGNIYDLAPGMGIVNESAHVEMALNASEWGGANQDENGNIVGGQPGDQTGREVYVKAPYYYGWNKVISWVNFDVGGAPAVETSNVPMPRYRVSTREHGWLPWMEGLTDTGGSGDDFAGVAGCWIYDVQFDNLGPGGWYKIIRADGSETTNSPGNTNSPVVGIVVYYDTPNPGSTGYYKAKYRVRWLGASPGWGKWEYDDEDGGAGKDADSPLDMIQLTLCKS